MQFNQTNNNTGGDVNNTITNNEKATVITGDNNTVTSPPLKPSTWKLVGEYLLQAWKWICGIFTAK